MSVRPHNETSTLAAPVEALGGAVTSTTTLSVDRLYEVLKAGERHAAEKHTPQKPVPTAVAMNPPKLANPVLPPSMPSPYGGGGVRAASAASRAGNGMGNTVSSTSIVESMMGKRLVTPKAPEAQMKVRGVEEVAASVETVEDTPAEEPEEEGEEAETEAPFAADETLLQAEMDAEEEAGIAAAIAAAATSPPNVEVVGAQVQESVEASTEAIAEMSMKEAAVPAVTAATLETPEAAVKPEAEEEPMETIPTYTLLGTEGGDEEQIPVSLEFEQEDGFHVAYIQHLDEDDNDTFTGIAVFPGDHIVVVSATNAPIHDHHTLDLDRYEYDLMDEITRTIPKGERQEAEIAAARSLLSRISNAAKAAGQKVYDSTIAKVKPKPLSTRVYKEFAVPDTDTPFYKKVMRRFKSALKAGVNPGNVSSAFHLVRIKTTEGAGKPVGSVPNSVHYVAAIPNNTGGLLSGTFKVEQWNMGKMAPFSGMNGGRIEMEVGGIVFYRPEGLEDEAMCLGHFFANTKAGGEVRNVKVSGTVKGKSLSTARSYRILGPEFSIRPGRTGTPQVCLHQVGPDYTNGKFVQWAHVDAWERQKTLTNYWRNELIKFYQDALKRDGGKAATVELNRFNGAVADREIKEAARRTEILEANTRKRPIPKFEPIEVIYYHTKAKNQADNNLLTLQKLERDTLLEKWGIDYDAFLGLNTVFSAMVGEKKLYNLILPYTPVSSGVYLKKTTYKPQPYRWTGLPIDFTTYNEETQSSYALRWIKAYGTSARDNESVQYDASGSQAIVGEDGKVGYKETEDNIAGVVDPVMVHIGGTSYGQDVETRIRDAKDHLHTLPYNTDFESYFMRLIAQKKKMKGPGDPIEMAKTELKETIRVVLAGTDRDSSNRYAEVINWYEKRSKGQKDYLGYVAIQQVASDASHGEGIADNDEHRSEINGAQIVAAAQEQSDSQAERRKEQNLNGLIDAIYASESRRPDNN